jgi:HSP20 family protein
MNFKLFSKKNKDNQAEDQDMFDQLENEFESREEPVADNQNKLIDTSEEQWLEGGEDEGQLAVDVYQDKRNNLVIKSTIAGAKPEEIDININNDMVTIKGSRHYDEEVDEADYFFQECYWGNFSRSIVLPQEVVAEKAQAAIKNGVLTIILPKAKSKKSVAVKVTRE